MGFEALARFDEGNPLDWFIGAAACGLSYELEVMAMRHALSALSKLPPDTYMAVNVAPSTVVDQRFAYDLSEFDLTHVVLELTEHDQVKDYDSLRRALDPLRDTGTVICTPVGRASTADRETVGNIRVSVDDLGAGFASMRHVLWLDPDFMKLDIDLVRGIDRSRAQRALASALSTFGSKMNVRMVAEGVETLTEYATLRAIDCHSAQGYLLGRPGPLPLPDELQIGPPIEPDV
jgi:EAL domain-containing protein (putative c-di-GMP-specific phosphodiesterase class I)